MSLTAVRHSPDRLRLEAGTHYRFSFDMNSCIGCHSCEVACAEANDLPVEIAWRRVGVVENADPYPDTRRFHLSMACNHCLEPACLAGCPTGAYEKLGSGIVVHHADDCIGCGYCSWNCPYDVPVMHPTKKIVTKCDMCRSRLEAGGNSACVDACPTHAIKVERIDPDEWRANPSGADAPGLPSAAITMSTTRVTLPRRAGATELRDVDDDTFAPEHSHLPLVWMTILVQLAAGATVCAAALGSARVASAALAAWLLALSGSLFHLGRPERAWKAIRNLRTSWLSREIAAFGAACASTALLVARPSVLVGVSAASTNFVALLVNAQVYRVAPRPAWDTPLTAVRFVASAARLGALTAAAVTHHHRAEWLLVSLAALLTTLAAERANIARLAQRRDRPSRATVWLWSTRFSHVRWTRAAIMVSSIGLGALSPWIGLALALVSEAVGRWLFFVTVAGTTPAGRWNAAWR
jgi:Fe-S-cluster-containing dehydrogenase component/DMSO reductase anchor subunit